MAVLRDRICHFYIIDVYAVEFIVKELPSSVFDQKRALLTEYLLS